MEEAKHKRTMKGTVVSAAMDKTAVVEVTRFTEHPKYRKYIKRSKRFKVHDASNEAKKGDEVLIEECRPVSKHTHFRIVR